MAVTTIVKISNVTVITQTAGRPKSYFGTSSTGKYSASPDGTEVVVQIGQDTYVIPWTDLRVNGSLIAPQSLSSALVLLNSFFGS